VSTNHGLAAPLAGVRVQVSAKQFDGDPTGWEEWGDTYTDSDGNFTIRNIKNQTNRLFRVRVMFKNDALRIYPPNDSLLKKFVDCAIGLIPGGIITSLAEVAEDALEQLLEQTTRVLYDCQWLTAHQDGAGNKHEPPNVDFGNLVFRAGGVEELGGATERKHAELWLIARKAMDLVNGLDVDLRFRGDRPLAFLYPHDNPVIGDAVEASYSNPYNDITFLINNSQQDHFNTGTILHELMHLWTYQHTSQEERLATYLLLHGSTHTGRLAPWVAWYEAFAEATSNELYREIFGTQGTVYGGFSAERRPFSRPYLIRHGITSLDDVQNFEYGWLSTFGLLLCPDVCDLDLTTSGPYAADTSPGVKDKGSPICSAPKIPLADLLRVVANAPDGRDGGMTRQEMQLGLFLRRCTEVLSQFTSEKADAYLRILDPKETRQPSVLLANRSAITLGTLGRLPDMIRVS